ncbi:uncharacterized protein LOC142228205 isoform X1 [Haematobia irritans]|uniref:uncharacterized protein LOC142228205 isoform X1 n=1 Tax=Haematobia irritans TaxID=7368 RepID=UPI003F503F5D
MALLLFGTLFLPLFNTSTTQITSKKHYLIIWSTTSTIVAQPIDTGTFTKTLTPSTTNPPVFITEVIVEEGQRES